MVTEHILFIYQFVGQWASGMIFLFLHENICCGYSLEVPHQSTSNEYPQHTFSCRNKKNVNTFGLKKKKKRLNKRYANVMSTYDKHF